MGWIPRQYPRFKAALSIELRLKNIDVPLRTQTADIGLGGCYVESVFTQEPSTVMDITLWVGDAKLTMQGEVVSKHPSFGNGLKFIRLTKEGTEKLGQYLESLKPQGLMMDDRPPGGASGLRRQSRR
jgi:c-di-GMP-binding flagellar brake protein YcgR